MRLLFSHPDYTVGSGISPDRRKNAFIGCTIGVEFRHAPKNIRFFAAKIVNFVTIKCILTLL